MRLALAFILITAAVASAASLGFESKIDNWRPLDTSAAWIGPCGPLGYSHDLSTVIDFTGGQRVTQAWLELDFTNDFDDSKGKVWAFRGWFHYDNREFAFVKADGHEWEGLGEVDNGRYVLPIDPAWINDDGVLDILLAVRNSRGTATAWLDHSRFYGFYSDEILPPPDPIMPEPVTLAACSAAALGLGGYVRRRRRD